jgi:hypothetical protein
VNVDISRPGSARNRVAHLLNAAHFMATDARSARRAVLVILVEGVVTAAEYFVQ